MRGQSDKIFSLLFEINQKPKRLYSRNSLRVELAEPILNWAGGLLGKMLGLRLAKWLEETLLKFLAEGQGLVLDIRSLGALKKAEALAEKARQRYGTWPAILFLTTHAPTDGPKSPLRFSILYQIQSLLRKQFPQYPAPMKFIVAIDPFALSDMGWFSESFAAGLLAARHLAIDRQSETQGLLQRSWIFRQCQAGAAPFRLSRLLRERVPVGMVLPGALPQNARVLYTLREFVRLRLKGNSSQEMAAAEILARPDEKGISACVTGKISSPIWKKLNKIFGRMPGALKREFAKEFAREVPYRRRFFRFLVKRVVSRGTAIILIPMWHKESDTSLHLSPPRMLEADIFPKRINRFAENFIRSGFPKLKPGEKSEPESLEEALLILDEMKHYPHAVFEQIQPFLGKKVLEIGCGIGTMTQHLLKNGPVVACDISDAFLSHLRRRFKNHHGNLQAYRWNMEIPAPPRILREGCDTILCLNVLEHIPRDALALRQMHNVLPEGGRLVLLVPAFPFLYGSLDKEHGHFRRYTKRELAQKLLEAGFRPERFFYLSPWAMPGWFLNGRILRKKHFSKTQALLYDRLVPLLGFLGKPLQRFFGMSLVAIAEK